MEISSWFENSAWISQQILLLRAYYIRASPKTAAKGLAIWSIGCCWPKTWDLGVPCFRTADWEARVYFGDGQLRLVNHVILSRLKVSCLLFLLLRHLGQTISKAVYIIELSHKKGFPRIYRPRLPWSNVQRVDVHSLLELQTHQVLVVRAFLLQFLGLLFHGLQPFFRWAARSDVGRAMNKVA